MGYKISSSRMKMRVNRLLGLDDDFSDPLGILCLVPFDRREGGREGYK